VWGDEPGSSGGKFDSSIRTSVLSVSKNRKGKPVPINAQQKYYAELNAKDEVALDLLAAMYAFHPKGDALFAAMERRKLNHSYGSGPLADAMEAAAQSDLTIFRKRMDEIRREVQI